MNRSRLSDAMTREYAAPAANALDAIAFSFDGLRRFDGFTDGSTWNGFDNVWVTPATWDLVRAYLQSIEPDALDAEAFDLAPDPATGLVSLANGWATIRTDRRSE